MVISSFCRTWKKEYKVLTAARMSRLWLYPDTEFERGGLKEIPIGVSDDACSSCGCAAQHDWRGEKEAIGRRYASI